MSMDIEELLAKLRKVEGGRPDSLGISTNWYRNPEGPQAADEIERLRERNETLQAEVERLRRQLVMG